MADDIFRVLHPAQPSPQKTVIVLGAPRGGTSMVAASLRKLGVVMGEKLGHQHEDASFRRDVPLENMIATVQQRNEKYDVWGWKMPNSIYYVEELLPHLRNPHFVAIFRNPFSISRSSSERDGRDYSIRLLQVAANHTKRIVDLMDRLQAPMALAGFEAVMQNREAFVRELGQYLGIETNETLVSQVVAEAMPQKLGYLAF